MCVGHRGRSRADSLLEYKWTFYFDRTTYRRLETFVVEHQSGPLPPSPELFSSFSVTWRTKKGSRKYILPPASECTYLDELFRLVDQTEYAEFVENGKGLMARERCSRP